MAEQFEQFFLYRSWQNSAISIQDSMIRFCTILGVFATLVACQTGATMSVTVVDSPTNSLESSLWDEHTSQIRMSQQFDDFPLEEVSLNADQKHCLKETISSRFLADLKDKYGSDEELRADRIYLLAARKGEVYWVSAHRVLSSENDNTLDRLVGLEYYLYAPCGEVQRVTNSNF